MVQSKIDIIKVSNGIFWVSIPQLNLRILCGCPADTVKHLKKRGLVDAIEQKGVKFETGPNVILLADLALQNGALSNLAEFPLLQMLYSQGMLIPNHPNNNGQKPLIMGSQTQIKAQLEYFYRGNYGLISKEELLSTGIAETLADALMHIKLKFAFGQLKSSDTLIDKLIIADEPVEIKAGAWVKRKDINIFEISFEDESVTIDLNLKPKEYYEPPYHLGFHSLKREYFSIVHTGEGDAWDVNRPCMASIVMFQGKIYLVDAGPDLLTSLNALGVSINEVAGIFNTHAHDDHFAGLISFVRSDHRIKYFASPPVRASVAKKLCALMGVEESNFERFFEVEDLKLDQWNSIEGLEVKPLISPHPVETNIFYFRTFWGNRYLTYGHLADVASFRVLSQNVYKNTEEQNYEHLFQKVKNDYLHHADLKKIDVGGGLIHGDAEDFKEDTSKKILLAHIARPLSDLERQIGSFAPFAGVDSLVETHQDFLKTSARESLKFYFPNVPEYEIQSLLNCPTISLTAGETLFKKGAPYDYVYLILAGSVELVYPDSGIENNLSAGSLVGYFIDRQELTAKATCQAASYATALKIPVQMYLHFVEKHQLVEDFNHLEKIVARLSSTWIFSENISLPVYMKLAQQVTHQTYYKGENLTIDVNTGFNLVIEGRCALLTAEGAVIENLKQGDFFGAEDLLPQQSNKLFEVFFLEDTKIYHVPIEVIMNIPIVYWKIHSVAERRMRSIV